MAATKFTVARHPALIPPAPRWLPFAQSPASSRADPTAMPGGVPGYKEHGHRWDRTGQGNIKKFCVTAAGTADDTLKVMLNSQDGDPWSITDYKIDMATSNDGLNFSAWVRSSLHEDQALIISLRLPVSSSQMAFFVAARASVSAPT